MVATRLRLCRELPGRHRSLPQTRPRQRRPPRSRCRPRPCQTQNPIGLRRVLWARVLLVLHAWGGIGQSKPLGWLWGARGGNGAAIIADHGSAEQRMTGTCSGLPPRHVPPRYEWMLGSECHTSLCFNFSGYHAVERWSSQYGIWAGAFCRGLQNVLTDLLLGGAWLTDYLTSWPRGLISKLLSGRAHIQCSKGRWERVSARAGLMYVLNRRVFLIENKLSVVSTSCFYEFVVLLVRPAVLIYAPLRLYLLCCGALCRCYEYDVVISGYLRADAMRIRVAAGFSCRHCALSPFLLTCAIRGCCCVALVCVYNRLLRITQRAKLSINHSIGRTHSGRTCIMFIKPILDIVSGSTRRESCRSLSPGL